MVLNAAVYDALTCNRPYSPARTTVEAGTIRLENSGEFDPALLVRFMKMLAIKDSVR